jgi:hypothetical protein
MNKNTTIHLLTGLLLALASSGAMAQTALQQLGAEAGSDTVSIARDLKAMRAMDAGPATVIGAARRPSKDAFDSCASIEAVPIMAWNASQAAIMVQTCLNHAYPADGDYQVRAQAARFGSRACPAGSGPAATCRAIIEVVGIKIVVTGAIPSGDPVLEDLTASMQKRGGKLLGFEAIIDNQAEVAP